MLSKGQFSDTDPPVDSPTSEIVSTEGSLNDSDSTFPNAGTSSHSCE